MDVQAFFDRLLELTDDPRSDDHGRVPVGERTAVMLTDLRARRDGVDYSLPEALVYEFNDAGKIVDVRQFLFIQRRGTTSSGASKRMAR